MEQFNKVSKEKRHLRTAALVTLVLLTLASLWLFYDLYAYLEIRAKSPAIEKMSNFIGAGFI